MKKVLSFLDKHFEEIICLSFMVVFVICTLLQVISRFLLKNITLSWTEELARYTFVWFVFMGIPWGFRIASHLTIDVLTHKLGPKTKRIDSILTHIIVLVMCVPMLTNSIKAVQAQQLMGQRLATLPVPMSLVYACMPVALIFSMLRCVQQIVFAIRDVSNKELMEQERIEKLEREKALREGTEEERIEKTEEVEA